VKRFAAVLLSALATTQIAVAQDDTRRWNMPTAYKGFHTENAVSFADCVRLATNGGIDITVRGGGELLRGGKIFAALKSGEVEIGERLLSSHSYQHRVFYIDSIPFLATSYEASEKLAIATDPAIRSVLETENLHLLYSVPWPAQGLFFKKKITNLSDMKGVKFRSYNDSIVRFSELFGMRPTWIDVDALAQSLATGVYDGLIASAKTVADRELWEVGISHYYRLNAWFPRNSVMVNLDTWRALQDDEREALTACGEISAKRGARLSREQDETNLAVLRKNGVIVEEPNEDFWADLVEKVGKQMIAEWLETADESSVGAIKSYRRATTAQ